MRRVRFALMTIATCGLLLTASGCAHDSACRESCAPAAGCDIGGCQTSEKWWGAPDEHNTIIDALNDQ